MAIWQKIVFSVMLFTGFFLLASIISSQHSDIVEKDKVISAQKELVSILERLNKTNDDIIDLQKIICSK